MNPPVPAVLAELANLAVRYAAPDAPPEERASNLMLRSMLLSLAAEVWDGAAARLVEENRALRTLLGEVGADADLRVSALKAENDRLRTALIEAQAAAEQAGDVARQDAIWERASGLEADPAALRWWILFNCVKGQAIWVGSARAFLDGGNREPILVYPAWWLINAQDRAILKGMGKL